MPMALLMWPDREHKIKLLKFKFYRSNLGFNLFDLNL